MTYKLDVDGFEGQTIEVVPPGILSGARLLVDGQKAEKGDTFGQMQLTRNDGRVVAAFWVPSFYGLDIPKINIDGKVIDVATPLKWFEWVWAALPIALIFVGGALGGLAGIVAATVNATIFRSSESPTMKFILSACVSGAAVVLYFVAAVLIFFVFAPAN
jgi:hypothetical protein